MERKFTQGYQRSYFDSENLQNLKPYLRIRDPAERFEDTADRERSPVLLSFSRTRLVEFDWMSLARESNPPASPSEQLRLEFEASWGFVPFSIPRLSDVVFQVTQERPFYFFLYSNNGTGEIAGGPQSVTDGTWIIHNRDNDEYYRVMAGADASVDFNTDAASYENTWASQVTELHRVYSAQQITPRQSKASAENGSVSTEELVFRKLITPPIALPDEPPPASHTAAPARESEPAPEGIVRSEDVFKDLPQMRKTVETSWGFKPHTLPPLETIFLISGDTPETSFHRMAGPGAVEKLEKGALVIRHGHGERYYWCVPYNGASLDFSSGETYALSWQRIERLELVSNDENNSPFPAAEEIDLGPQAIIEEFRELDLYGEFSRTLSDKADQIPDSIDALSAGAEQIEEALQTYRRLKMRHADIERDKEILQQRARKLGFHLAIIDEEYQPVAESTESKVTLEKGRLYRTFINRAQWTETVAVPKRDQIEVTVGFWPFYYKEKRSIHRTVQRPMAMSREYVDYEKVEVDSEPWMKKLAEIQAEAGTRCFVFDMTDTGYVTDQGERLEDVMAQCHRNEIFRLNTVLFIPAYQQRLVSGIVKSKYLVIRRPIAGMAPIGQPQFMIEEHLSYRSQWQGTELGQLTHSLNLAPGETRTVNVSRSIRRETEVVESINSVLDVTESRGEDLESSIEKTARNEGEQTSSDHWNAKAGGSYGGFSASGEAGGSNAMSSKQFAEKVGKIASKAARNMARNQRQEVSSSSTSRSVVETSESSVGEITNINQGRTLNLLFYQLNNVFHGGVFLEKLRLIVVPSTEIVAGSGIRIPFTFDLSNLSDCLTVLAADKQFWGPLGIDPINIKLVALRALFRTLTKEYINFDHAGLDKQTLDNWNSHEDSSKTLGFGDKIPQAILDAFNSLGNANWSEEQYLKELKLVAEILVRLTEQNEPVDPHRLVVPSGALYLDALVGMQPATEAYSEEMRLRELGVKDADITQRQAEAELTRAKADSYRRMPATSYTIAEPAIKNVIVSDDRLTLTVMLSSALPRGRWQLTFAGLIAADIVESDIGSERLEFHWKESPEWMQVLDTKSLRLIEKETGASIA
ncbi:hypothetical protein AB833_04480 [Chromatiales bacterium (ex Bugula neritina AB1)]|nr:hypothetical protein AB833_04480 [Chromatiales bacterium (ex Bugula neritina AB1)]